MPRHAKGPRLWLRPRRGDRPAAWFILDGNRQRGTGLGRSASEQEKEQALQAYLVEKHTIAATSGSRDPSQIPVADVLAHYVRNVLPDHSQTRGDKAADQIPG